MPLRPCLTTGCGELVRRGRCAPHQRARDAAKNAQEHRWVYRDPRWFRARARALERAGHRCQALEAGLRCRATSALHGHHDYEGGVRRMLADGVDPFDERRIVILCETHHGRVERALGRGRNRSRRR